VLAEDAIKAAVANYQQKQEAEQPEAKREPAGV
jgi:hypothetical protein